MSSLRDCEAAGCREEHSKVTSKGRFQIPRALEVLIHKCSFCLRINKPPQASLHSSEVWIPAPISALPAIYPHKDLVRVADILCPHP